MNNINIEDINYIISHEELNPPVYKEKYSSSFFLLLKGWCLILLKGIYSIRYFFIDYYKNLEHSDILFLAFSSNNERALRPVYENLKEISVFYDLNNPLPLRRIWLHALIYSPIVIRNFFVRKGYLKKAYATEFVSYCKCFGFFIEAKMILKKIKPQFLVLANDHSYPQRAFFRAAKTLNIKTVYIQHASVTENFPPLEFDIAFLDGEESYDKYIANNKKCDSIVFLSGNPRFDIIASFEEEIVEEKKDIYKCGIAINEVDNVYEISALLNDLNRVIPKIMITLRPHPSMDEIFWRLFAKDNKCEYSSAREENPFIFIMKNDFFIAGESSFHLDALLCSKKSFYVNFTKGETLDWYNYLATGLVKDITNMKLQEILKINKEINKINLIQYYVSNYSTDYWGKSSYLISQTMLSFLDGEILNNWRKRKNNLYEIKN